MSCTLSDNELTQRGYHTSSIIKEPICRPEKIQNKITEVKISLSLIILIILCTAKIPGEFLIIAIAFMLMIFYTIVSMHKAYADKRLQDPNLNPSGYKYQGRILREYEPHYLLHLEYYKRHKTWTIPDGINPKDYIKQDHP